MPVRKQGSGYQWGSRGKVYTGAGAREKAAAQGRAAYASGYNPTGGGMLPQPKAKPRKR